MTIALTIIHVLIAIALIVFIMMQEGNDGGISGAIGGGSAMTQSAVHKKRGLEEKIIRITVVFAVLFFVTALLVAVI